MLSAYYCLFVPGFNQGHWYYPVSTLFVSVAGLEVWTSRRSLPSVDYRFAIGVALVFGAIVFVTFGRRADYHRRFATFYFDDAPAVRAAYHNKPPKLFAFDDG